ncbi:DNA polymerase III subunit delta' [Desulforhopalus singaporensis]|uniref:DNA polymerase III, delta prime subunit n=1 Tax=Desulforhopalus singaporensis TaxID=91360 RepID=A0A1H0JV30_9BACT|nr:DNA polymerase III subunit delta' [Desulforhopalus singaporensis]SDO47362.1 DNA polymerase III, delta prime subunit [Desulforhopalus singaporensis]
MDQSPLCYTQLFGQDRAKKMLSRALAGDRLPHAFLFRGEEGVGKQLFARGVAAAVNCRDVNRVGACGICSSCRKFISSNQPDYVVIRPDKGVIKIDRIRQLIRELEFAPYESPVRVVVIEDVHAMRREAANALLKTLEEPPAKNLFILTAESSQEMLPTLVSRCQVIFFGPLSIADTVAVLQRHDIDAENRRLLAQLSGGSPGKALVYERAGMVPVWREVVTFLGDPRVDPNRDAGELLILAEKMAALKEDFAAFLGLLRYWLRDLLLARDQGENGGVSGRMLKSWSSVELFAKLRAIDRAERQLAGNCNKNLVAEALMFSLQD